MEDSDLLQLIRELQKKIMSKTHNQKYVLCFVLSIVINLMFIHNWYCNLGGNQEWKQSWTRRAAEEAEKVGAISCSGHGRAYLDGQILDDGKQQPICECNSCYEGADCSVFSPSCAVNADGGDPLFLEPYWVEHASGSAVVTAGWHRMSYSFPDQSFISKELERHIRKLHAVVGNAITHERYIVFGGGSTQLLNAAVHSLSSHNHSSSPAKVVASIPFYPVYEIQTDYFRSVDFNFGGDTSLWKNNSDVSIDMIEFVTSPNNPDGQLKNAVLEAQNSKVIYDHAYYWPHFTAIPAPAHGDMMLFTLSKFTGHAGSRFGWAIIKNEAIYQKMIRYLKLNTMGVSRETQLRALKLLKVVLQESSEKNIFEFGHETMKKRWDRLSETISKTNRFSLQKIPPQYCTFSKKVKEASPAYGWMKCEREEDKDCRAVLEAANIISRHGSVFFADDRYVRLSLIRRQDDFDLLIHKLNQLVHKEDGPKSM